jgi:hypothetical protein
MPDPAKRGPKPRDPSGAGSPSTVWLTPADRERLATLKESRGLSVADVLRLGMQAAEKPARKR